MKRPMFSRNFIVRNDSLNGVHCVPQLSE